MLDPATVQVSITPEPGGSPCETAGGGDDKTVDSSATSQLSGRVIETAF
jgi:hypothetical protein